MADVDLQGKDILNIDFPMTRDEDSLAKAHADGASALEEKLAAGRDVALITLGCPTIYASSLYVQRIVEKHGYKTEIIPGVPSFCAAAARLGRPLCEKDDHSRQSERPPGPAGYGRQQGRHEAGGAAG